MGKAKLSNTSIDTIKAVKSMEKKQAGRIRADFAGVSTQSVGINTVGSSNENNNRYSQNGGRISGPISFFPKTIDIVDGAIDLADQTDATGNVTPNTSNVNVIGEGNAADDLTTINSNSDTGQVIFLKAAGYQLTLKHGTGNQQILTPGATDYVMEDDEGCILMFGSTGNTWMVLGSSGGSEVFDWTAAHRANGNSLFLDTNDDTLISGATDDEIDFQTGGTTRMTLSNTLLELETIDFYPEADDTQFLGGSSNAWAAGYINQLIMEDMNSNITDSSTGAVFTNSTKGTVIKSPTVSSSYGAVSMTDKDGVNRIVHNFNASGKNTIHYYETGGLLVRKNADAGDTIDLYPPGNVIDTNQAILNGNSATLSTTRGMAISLTGGIKIQIGSERTTLTNDYVYLDADQLVCGENATDFTIFMGYSGGVLDQYIHSDSGGIEMHIARDSTLDIYNDGTKEVVIDYLGLGIEDEKFVQPSSTGNDVIGFVPFRDATLMTTIGSRGTNLTPTIESTATITDSQLNSWFGNGKGATGMVYDTSKTTGSGRMRLYMKGSAATSSWRAVEFDINP